MQTDWELSQTLRSIDETGIRAACVLSDERIIVGTQSGAIQEFFEKNLIPIAYQHNHAVTALLAGSSTDSDNTNLYVTGCKDADVRIFDANTHQLTATLKGHEKPVTSLSWCGSRYLVSGSWDGTAKVWDMTTNALVATLPGHENSVCVVGLSSDENDNVLIVATGSAGVAQNNVIQGHTVRIWSIHVVTGEVKILHQVANDHEGPIRGICCVVHEESPQLATCSNDGTVKLRSSSTAVSTATLGFVSENQQHPPMLLSVVPLADNSHLVACAEDGTVVLWDLQGSPQTVLHPACVWSVVPLSNGDFGTCCDDGSFRIFTRAAERFAPTTEREALAEAVAQQRQKQQGGPSADEIAKLPHWHDNARHTGTSEGQVQLFQKDGVAIAAQWNAASRSWVEVGQVMGSNNTGTIDGVSYDHVLPIEVDQTGGGVASLQIGYNNGENPFVAAQRFIDAHMLPQYHLAQIADYIQQRVGKAAPTIGATTATTSTASTGVPIAAFQYIPAKRYKTFEISDKNAKTMLDKMKTKITETGKLTDTELQTIDSLMQTLMATNRYHASKIASAELQILLDMLERLEPAESFPALDLARMAVLHPAAAAADNTSLWQRIMAKALEMMSTFDTMSGPAAVAVPMLSLRLFANAFKGGPGSVTAVVSFLPQVVKCAASMVATANKNVRLSVATVVHNVSLYLHKNPAAFLDSPVGVASAILTSKAYEEEAVMRTIVGLGTIVLSGEEAKKAANSLFLASKVEPAASPHGEQVKMAAKEVYAALS